MAAEGDAAMMEGIGFVMLRAASAAEVKGDETAETARGATTDATCDVGKAMTPAEVIDTDLAAIAFADAGTLDATAVAMLDVSDIAARVGDISGSAVGLAIGDGEGEAD